jgi:hypothetical protein
LRDSIDRFVGQCKSASEAEGVSQFVDLGVLLPVVVEVLVDALVQCLGEEADPFEHITRRGFWARYCCRKAIKAAAKQTETEVKGEVLGRLSDLLLVESHKLGRDGFGEIVSEIKRAPDFEIWG